MATYFNPWVGKNYQTSKPRILVIGDSHYCGDDCAMRNQCGVRGNLPPSSMGKCQDFTNMVTRRYLDYRTGRAEGEGWMTRTYLSFEKMLLGKSEISPAESLDIWNRVAFYNFVQTAAPDPSNDNFSVDEYKRSTPLAAEVMEALQPDIILVWGAKAYGNLPDRNYNTVSDCCVDYTLASGRKARCLKLTHPSRASYATEHAKLSQLVKF